jgi:hypothetical protein
VTPPGLSGPRFRRAAECLRDDPWMVDASVSCDIADVLDRAAAALDAHRFGALPDSVDWPALEVIVNRVEKEARFAA